MIDNYITKLEDRIKAYEEGKEMNTNYIKDRIKLYEEGKEMNTNYIKLFNKIDEDEMEDIMKDLNILEGGIRALRIVINDLKKMKEN